MNSEKKERMTLKERDERAQKDLDLFYTEIQTRKTNPTFEPSAGEFDEYDVLFNGLYHVELKRRYIRSDNKKFQPYYIRKSKVDWLRKNTPRGILVFFFNDRWFAVDVRKNFEVDDPRAVDNPREGERKEINYLVRPEDGKFYEYKTDPATLKKLLSK